MSRVCLLLAHGWGCDATIWDELRAALGEADTLVVERGYFGARPDRPRPPPGTIAVGHSAGLLDLLADLPPGCAGVVAINGFTRFAHAADFPDGTPTRVLDRMARRLSNDPDGTVRAFRDRSGLPPPTRPARRDRLREGLDVLATQDCGAALRGGAAAGPGLRRRPGRHSGPHPGVLRRGRHRLAPRRQPRAAAGRAGLVRRAPAPVRRVSRRGDVGGRFDAAAASYDRFASVQRLVAHRLADRIAASLPDAGSAPLRILEIGCGTGLLTEALRRRLPPATIVATDLAPSMLQACRARLATGSLAGDDRLLLLAADAMQPAVSGGFDLLCSSLTLQWLDDPVSSLRTLVRLLRPGGRLHVATLVAGTLAEWRAAHASEGLVDGGLAHPPIERLAALGGTWDTETIAVAHPDGLSFLRSLRGIGADLPVAGRRPLGPGALRRVLRRFEAEHDGVASYRIAYGCLRRPSRRGVFVTGTDTGIGKTLVSACLLRAWSAEYWKPLQTGLDDDPGDGAVVSRLAGLPADRLHPPVAALRASLSPEDAARLEGVAITRIEALPPPLAAAGDPPLVVEGAGGVLVPVDADILMADLIGELGLPAILVARSTLGTINHTLLSLAALRERGVRVAGVIMNGPASPGNRSAIERHGAVRVLAEIPTQDRIDPETVARLAALMPSLDSLDIDLSA